MIPLRLTFTSMILFWLALSFSAYGNINIRVVEATGSPLMLPPFHGHWIPLDIGMRLYQGTLVQVRENESLLLRWNKNDRNTPQQIEIDFPFMFRISEEMYRDIEIVIREIKDYKDLLNKTKNPNKKKEKTNFYDISSAWEWGLFKENIKVEKAAAEEDKWFKMQFDELLRQEDNNSPDPVIRPLENEIIQADGFPSEVSVTLSENLDQFPYEVYVWRKIDGSTPPKTPLVLTDSRYFSLPTFEQGEYYMTLLGRDQNFTKLRSFSVADKTLTPIDIRNTTIRVIEKLKQPIDQSKWLITSDEKRAKIPFSFLLSENYTVDDLGLVVINLDNNKRKRFAVKPSKALSLNLNPGRYRWYLKSKNLDLIGSSYHFTVKRSSWDELLNLISKPNSQMTKIYLQ